MAEPFAGMLAPTRAECSCLGGAVARVPCGLGLLALRSASGLGREGLPRQRSTELVRSSGATRGELPRVSHEVVLDAVAGSLSPHLEGKLGLGHQ
jgi:hypothetical protein